MIDEVLTNRTRLKPNGTAFILATNLTHKIERNKIKLKNAKKIKINKEPMMLYYFNGSSHTRKS